MSAQRGAGTAARAGRPRRAGSASGAAARAVVVIDLLLVALAIGLIAVWAFSDRWSWPDLLPQSMSLRGMREVLFGGNGMALLGGSVAIALCVAVITTIVATLAARAVCLHEWRGRTVFNFALLTPFLIPSTVFAMGVQVLFIQVGLARTLPGVVLAHAIVALPYACAIMIDVTRAVGSRLDDAARTCGAGPLNMAFSVTLPQLMPGILSALSMSYIISFSQYFLTLLIGGGAVRTFATVMFPYLVGGDRTIAAAYGLVFIVVTFGVFLLFEALLARFGYKEQKGLFL